MRRIILIVTLLFITTYANAEVLHKRVMVSLNTTNITKANQIENFKNQVSQNDKWTDEDTQFKKNLNLEKSFDGITYFISGSYLFKTDTKAQQVYNFIKNNMPAGINGVVSIHNCPTEESITDWGSCKTDPRAEYEETVF